MHTPRCMVLLYIYTSGLESSFYLDPKSKLVVDGDEFSFHSLTLRSRARWNLYLTFATDTAGLFTESFAEDLATDLLATGHLATDRLGMESSRTTGTAARYPCGTSRIRGRIGLIEYRKSTMSV